MATVRREYERREYLEEERAYSLRDFFTFLFRRRRVVIGFFLAVVSTVSLWTLLVPPTYETKATILLKKSRAEVSLGSGPNLVTEEDLNSEIQILTSRQLIQEVLTGLGIDESRRPRSRFDGARAVLQAVLRKPKLTYLEENVLVLERDLSVNPIRSSNMLSVSFRSKDRQGATEVARALTERYLERRTEIYQSAHAVSFFEQEAQSAKERLGKAEANLGEFLKGAETIMVKTPEGSDPMAVEKELALQRLSQTLVRLAEIRSALGEQRMTVAELEARLAGEPERLASSNRYNLNPAVEEIEKGLVSLELRRDALIQDFRPESRQVQDVRAQIELAKQQLRGAQKQVGSIDRTEPNPVHQALRTRVLHAQAELEGTRVRYEALERQGSSDRQVIDDLNEKSFALEKLNREVKSAEEAYLLYRRKFEEARISAAMDQEKIVNVSIVQPAQKPLKAVSPKKMVNLMIALILGLVGGVGLALLLEYFDHTFTTGLDVERRLNVPHLASIRETG